MFVFVGSRIYKMFILNKFGGNMVFFDSIIMVLSYVAVFLMTNKYMEQWIVWIIVNVSGTIMWGIQTLQNPNNMGLLVMWIIFLCNSVYGFINWRKLYKEKLKIADNI